MKHAGDFAQTIPVVRFANRASQVDASIKRWNRIWNKVEVWRLNINERIKRNNPEEGPQFLEFANSIGRGINNIL